MPSDEGDKLRGSILSHLDIPVFFWVPTDYDNTVIGPREEGRFERYLHARAVAEEAALQTLASMSDLQLYHLNDDSTKLAEFARNHELFDPPDWYAEGFGFRPERNYQHWFKMEFWTVMEATCLSIGFDPKAPKLPAPKGLPSPYESEQFFRERYELIERAFGSSEHGETRIAPVKFVKWVHQQNIEVSTVLLGMISGPTEIPRPGMLRHVDERKYHSAQKVILALLATLYGNLESSSQGERVSDICSGLEKLGLSMDPKTIKSAIKLAEKNLLKFQDEQHQKDERGS